MTARKNTHHYRYDFQSYLEAILKEAAHHNRKHIGRYREDYCQALSNLLFPDGGSTTVSKKRAWKSHFTMGVVFSGFHEIHETLERIKEIRLYLGRYPFGNNPAFSRAKFLTFLVESYLHETYVLKERLKAYPKQLLKCLGGKVKNQQLAEEVNTARNQIDKAFNNTIELRGKHVHEYRYDDKNFRRLNILELTKTGEPELEALHDSSYKETRKKWIIVIDKNIKDIESFLDVYFNWLYPYIFTKNGKIKIPKKPPGWR